ncbi:MAG TPA: GTP-dependent dephospho-CoA kinase family protein [bacterium]|nr:GTP-dependent dephospho-CoA kinase family protein [bacterium]
MSYTKIVWVISSRLRALLSKPMGRVYNDKEYLSLLSKRDLSKVITVGDVVSSTAFSRGYRPRIMVVDQKTKRNEFAYDWKSLNPIKVWNPAGMISLDSLIVFSTALNKKDCSLILVDGEEDLLTLVAIILSPTGYSVFYGQPERGVVCVNVNKTKRLEALNIFNEMVVKSYV